ncbi:MAG: hydrogenase membrane subunit [Methanomicrobiales archaeon]|nr:hydrogenase membrane subunit [Methanomicrobiales archaeon]
MPELLFALALACLAAGIIIPLLTSRAGTRAGRTFGYALTIAASVFSGIITTSILLSGEPVSFVLYQPFPSFSIAFVLDRLAAFFVLIIAVVSGCVSLYAIEYTEHLSGGSRRNLLCSCANLFILSMVLVVASANTLAFLFFWELMAASSFFLVMYEYAEPETRKAGIFYFIMTQFSTLFVLLGIISLYGATGSFAFTSVAGISSPLITAAFICLFLGFSIKAGIIPFHKWLPYAHPASPSPISALMSAVMLKVAVYAFIRVLLDVFVLDLAMGLLILAAGTASAILGIIYALKEHDIKAMLAYSSIENVGIIFMGIGLFVIFTSQNHPALAMISLLGALFHALNHALFKSLLFLTAGSVVHATHTRDIEHLGGLVHRMPRTSVLFFIGSLSIAALPPLNGFASEFLIFISFFSSVSAVDPLLKVIMFICLSLFALTSALSLACFVKAFGSVFLALPRSAESEHAHEVPALMIAGPALLAAACIILGLFAAQLFMLAGYSVPMPDMLLAGILLLIMTGLTFAALYVSASQETRISETWGCGTLSQGPSTEYSGHGFSEPLDIIFSSIYRTRMKNERRFFDQKNCIFMEGTAEIRLIRVFEEYLYLPVARASMQGATAISRFQNGCLDTYLLYVFLTVIAIIVYLGWFL